MKLTAVPRRRARIEIIPLIDVVFFLLATFVMVSLSMIKNHGLPVNLPVASSASPQERKDSAVLTLKPDGGMFFDKESLRGADLPARLGAFKAAHAEPRVFIQADEAVSWGEAIAALDTVRRSGISRVAVETRKPAAGP